MQPNVTKKKGRNYRKWIKSWSWFNCLLCNTGQFGFRIKNKRALNITATLIMHSNFLYENSTNFPPSNIHCICARFHFIPIALNIIQPNWRLGKALAPLRWTRARPLSWETHQQTFLYTMERLHQPINYIRARLRDMRLAQLCVRLIGSYQGLITCRALLEPMKPISTRRRSARDRFDRRSNGPQ